MAETLGESVDVLVSRVRASLDSSDPEERLTAMRQLALGVSFLERGVIADAAQSELTWAAIGSIYGVSRQAAHRKFSDDTVLTTAGFDAFLAELDADDEHEVSEPLLKAAYRASGSIQRR